MSKRKKEKALEQIIERLKKEWPHKCCACKRVYVRNNRERIATPGSILFRSLPLKANKKDEFGLMQYRNCPCGSTLMVVVMVFNLEQE